MIKIYFDTNFLIDVVRFRIDLKEIANLVLEPYKLYTFDNVVNELEKIKSKHSKVALEIIKNRIVVVKSDKKNVDKAFLVLTDKNTIVATNDSKLRKQLKTKGIRTIFIKSRKQLDID